MDRSRLGIVIPALNESTTIANVVEVAKRYGLPIVVDDGSTDDTAKLSQEAGAIVVSHGRNRGYDVAINSGFRKAIELNTEVIITLDADGQHDPTLIQNFIEQMDAGADMVIGIRGSRQRMAEHLFAWYTNIRFGIKDPLCGMKAYRRKIFDASGHFDSYGSVGTELMIFAAKKKYNFVQIPLNVKARTDQSRFGRVIVGNYRICRAMAFSIWRRK